MKNVCLCNNQFLADRLVSVAQKNFNAAIFPGIINFKLCMKVLLFDLYLFTFSDRDYMSRTQQFQTIFTKNYIFYLIKLKLLFCCKHVN